MWNFRYVETKRPDGEKLGKANFWEVGVSRKTQRTFKRTFRRTLEHSTPRKAYEDFARQFSHDAIDYSWSTNGLRKVTGLRSVKHWRKLLRLM